MAIFIETKHETCGLQTNNGQIVCFKRKAHPLHDAYKNEYSMCFNQVNESQHRFKIMNAFCDEISYESHHSNSNQGHWTFEKDAKHCKSIFAYELRIIIKLFPFEWRTMEMYAIVLSFFFPRC